MKFDVIPEIDVLIATSLWLLTQRALPFQYSVAKGQGINSRDDKERLVKALDDVGAPSELRRFVPSGPDVIAISKERYWQVECKGAGTGQQSTQQNYFARAVASTVSYYTDKIPEFAEAKPTLGLAIPATHEFLSLLRNRVPVALRERLELWVLLYNIQERRIEPIEPSRKL